MTSQSNLYDLLGLPRDATPEEIRRAYREAALKMHPDVSKIDGKTEFFLDIQKAYDILSDPKKRKDYDESWKSDIKSSHPILTNILYSRPHLPILDEQQLLYILLDIAPNLKDTKKENLPINACLVIDRSTSMQGERMDTVKSAAIELIHRLNPNDFITIVSFSDRAEVLVPATQAKNSEKIETQIRMLRPSGGTEIYQGLLAAYQEIRRNIRRSAINHIVLLTDGRTYGDEEDCLNLADDAATRGIRITGLGIGNEWNDIFLDALTARTGGSSFYIAKTGNIKKLLKEKFRDLGHIFAEQVRLHLENSIDVRTSSAFRLSPDSSEIIISTPLRLGSIPSNAKLSVLLEFVIPPIDPGTKRITISSGELSIVRSDKPDSTFQLPLRFTRLIGDLPDSYMPPKPIYQALSHITLYKMQDRARQEVAEGKIEQASLRLQHIATQLLTMGEDKLAETAMLERQRIQKTHAFSEEGEKLIKYGTRSLLLPESAGDR